ncbi:hypothetical protein D3C85_164630 [compost metagenome]|jgi:hypothetical protein
MSETAFLDKETPEAVREEITRVLAIEQNARQYCENGRTDKAVAMLREDYPHVAFKLDMYSVNGACV